MDHAPQRPKSGRDRPRQAVLFASPEVGDGDRNGHRQGRNQLPWVLAILLIAAIVAIVIALGNRHIPGPLQTTDQPGPYAVKVELSNLHVIQGTNFAGSPVTYIDGTITNHGTRTVVGVIAGTTFPAANPGDEPSLETAPVLLVQTRKPVADTEPLSIAPLAPGASHDFRLIFAASGNPNVVLSGLHLVSVKTR